MASLPPIKRFLADDFPTEATWIGNLLTPLNLLLNTIYAALNNGLTIQQNMLAQINTMSISGTNPATTFLWKYSVGGAPIGISVINTVNTSTPTPIVNAVTCQWTYNAGTISITNVTGLSKGNTYNVTFIVWGG